MTIDECKRVLAKIQLGDNRQVDELTLREWFNTIGHLNFADTIEAVTLHRQESDSWLMPSHLVANVHRIRTNRELNHREIERHINVAPRPSPEVEAEMIAAHRAGDHNRLAAAQAAYHQECIDAGTYA